jgi:hypothetical protein
MTCVEKAKSFLPSFIKFDNATSVFDIKPLASDKAGTYIIQVTLTDSFGEAMSYYFNVIVKEPPKPTQNATISTFNAT